MSLYYQDDFVTLYHGDCLKEHREWLTADVLVTDPPYGYGHKSGGGPRGNASWKNSQIANDQDTGTRDDALSAWGDRPAIVFGSWKRPRPINVRALLIWDKGGHAGMGDLSIPWKPNFEDIYILGDGFKGKRESGVLSGFHVPANEAAGRVTIVAAKALGRKTVAVEISERHCEQIAKRCAQDVLDIFGEAS